MGQTLTVFERCQCDKTIPPSVYMEQEERRQRRFDIQEAIIHSSLPEYPKTLALSRELIREDIEDKILHPLEESQMRGAEKTRDTDFGADSNNGVTLQEDIHNYQVRSQLQRQNLFKEDERPSTEVFNPFQKTAQIKYGNSLNNFLNDNAKYSQTEKIAQWHELENESQIKNNEREKQAMKEVIKQEVDEMIDKQIEEIVQKGIKNDLNKIKSESELQQQMEVVRQATQPKQTTKAVGKFGDDIYNEDLILNPESSTNTNQINDDKEFYSAIDLQSDQKEKKDIIQEMEFENDTQKEQTIHLKNEHKIGFHAAESDEPVDFKKLEWIIQ